jgi:hypothetical protein
MPPYAAAYNQDFTYQYNGEGVHEMILHTRTPLAVKECLNHFEEILSVSPKNQPLLVLGDGRQSGVPPFAELWREVRRVYDLYPEHPPIITAVLHNLDGNIFKSFVMAVELLAAIPGAKINFFTQDKHDEAVRWLIEQSDRNASAI